MNDKATLSRRDFLMITAAAAVSVIARSQVPGVVSLQRGQQILQATQLAALMTHQESAKAVGREYLRQYRQEADPHVLLEQIAGTPALGQAQLFGSTGQDLRGLLGQLIREDFAADRVVKLRGWILSATEARLCALAVLM